MPTRSAFDVVTPLHLRPVVEEFHDVIVDRAPPVKRRPPAARPSVLLQPSHIEPLPHGPSPLDMPDEDTVDFEPQTEAWFAAETLAPPPRVAAPAAAAAEVTLPAEEQFLASALVALGGVFAFFVAAAGFVAAYSALP